MAIDLNEKTGVISLHTAHTTYQMKVDHRDTLLHTYYGARIDDTDMSTQIVSELRGFSSNTYETGFDERNYSLDTLPQEYTGFGTGDYRITALRVRNADGSRACRFKYSEKKVEAGKYRLEGLPAVYVENDCEAETLSITLRDSEAKIAVELLYGVLEGKDIITRAARITNEGDAPIHLEKVSAVNLDLPFGDWDWITFYGRHSMERHFERQNIKHGNQSVGSVRGISSFNYNPFAVLCTSDATETAGDCIGCAFVYTGEFKMETDKDQMNSVRFICGINPDGFDWVLDPGETFTVPEVILTFSSAGFGDLSNNLHRCMRENVMRGYWKHRPRPILINNWEATYFTYTGSQLLEIAEHAKELGVELFAMDDGWFGKRDTDDAGLGDWYPNEEKLHMPLHELAQRVIDMGMKFGIWFEPESISIDSDLYRAHPDWAVTIPGRLPAIDRRQLTLDFTREDVRAYILERLTDILENNPISFVKWDINRSICDKYSHELDADHQGEFAHRMVLGLYDVLEKLTSRFPEVLFEGCAGGGGRYDAGLLYYMPELWPSDNTDAFDRLIIQYGTSFGYPVHAMGTHVSTIPNHQTGRTEPLKARGVVAMSGSFGLELDLTKVSDADKEEIKEQIKTFHRFYDLIHYGNYYRLSTPDDYVTVWQFASENKQEALVNAIYHNIVGSPAPAHVKLRGLDPDRYYHIEVLDYEREAAHFAANTPDSVIVTLPTDYVMSGSALMNGGLTIPKSMSDGQAWQIYLNAVPERQDDLAWREHDGSLRISCAHH